MLRTVSSSADSAMASTASDAVTIGRNANATVDGGVALGSSSVASVDKGALGYNPSVEALTDAEKASATWTSTLAAVSVGDVSNNMTRQITGVAAGTADSDAVNVAQLKANKVTLTAGDNVTITPTTATDGSTDYKIASTDTNTYVTEGALSEDGTLTLTRNDKAPVTISGFATKEDVAESTTHYYSVNDWNNTLANYDNTGAKAGMSVAAGPAAMANGSAATVTGAFSRVNGNGSDGMAVGFQGATASVYGSFNVVGAQSEVGFDGVANSIIGVANKTENANAALIMGAGNKISNSYRPVDLNSTGPLASAMQKAISTGDNDDMITALSNMVKTSGGAVLAMGGANTADYALLSKVVGVGNTLTGTEGNESKLNMLDGYMNTGTNVNNVTIIGSGNTVTNTNKAVVIGDSRQLTSASNSVILGSADRTMATTVADATAIGHNANVTVANGVALGSGSVASVDAGVAGYDVETEKASTETSATWKSTLAAVSVGVPTDGGAATATRQITGVAAGMQDTDAVNVAQLKKVAEAANEAGNTTLKFTGDDTTAEISRTNNQVLNITGGATATDADGNSLLTDNNIGVVKEGDSALKVQLAKNLTGLNSVAVGNAVTLDTNGLTITNGPSVTTTGIDAGSKVITNVANGVNPTDAVNVSQLTANKVTVAEGTNVTVTPTTANDGSTTYTVAAKDTYTTAGTYDKAGKKITFTQNDTDKNYEVDVSGLVDGISEDIDKGLNFAGDSGDAINKKLDQTLDIVGGAKGDLTTGNIGVISEDGKLNVRLAKDVQDLNSVRIGGTTTDGKGIYIANQTVTTTKDGVDPETGNYITGLTNKTWNPKANGYVSGRAATEDQLNSVYEAINTSIEANKVTGSRNITVDENNKVNLNDNITLGGDTAANQVNINGNDAKVTAGDGANKVVVDGSNGQVTIGEAGKGVVLGKQTDVVGTKSDNSTDKQSGHFITGLDNTTWDPATKGIVENRAATEGQLKDIADQISSIDTAVKSSSRVFESDSTEQVTRKNTDPMKLKGGATGELSDGNIGVVNNSDKTGFDIKLAKDIKGLNSIEVNNKITIGTGDNQTIIEGDTINTGSVTTGNTTINNDGLTIVNEDSSKNITINNNNVNMGGNVIKNIGEGSEPTDAINKGQFDRAINNLGTGMNQINNRVNKLDNRVNCVGAGAAALAALHPLEFSPDAKWEVTAGVGNYRGANAIALGAFYRPNFDTMFSIGTSYGGGENMINAGVTWRIGEGETKAYPSKTVMAQEIDDLKTVVSEQQDQIEELKKLVNSLINK